MLQVEAEHGDITEVDVDAIVVNLFEDVRDPGGATGAVDGALDGAIADVIGSGDFTGELGSSTLLYAGDDLAATRVLVVGLGDRDDVDLDAVRRAAGTTVDALGGTEVDEAATIVHGGGIGGLSPRASARAIAMGAISKAYRFHRKTNGDEGPDLQRLAVVERSEDKLAAVRQGLAAGRTVANAQAVTRDIASFSGEEAAPAAIAGTIEAAAEDTGLDCTVWGPEEIAEQRMGGVQAVSRGSEREPRFVQLEWDPGEADRTVCLVGKGVTFDTGGISLKRSSGMDEMRYDKHGAASVVGTLLAAAELELDTRVIGLTPFVENMPSGSAIKPGDVIKMRNGSTVDVINTDAEGRLILADALDLARERDPDATVDLATLTGSVSVALGTQAAGLFGNDDELVAELETAAEATSERVWRLPLFDEYEQQLDEGAVGDLQNVGGRNAGASVAGKFLEHFAPEDGWAHLDIAGVAWNDDKPYLNPDYTPKGATGVGVRLLVDWLEDP
jgi:leucyl aminopeptidase